MKSFSSFQTMILVATGIAAIGVMTHASAASISVTHTYLGTVTHFPGSADDFTLLGGHLTFPDDTNYGPLSLPSVQTYFSLASANQSTYDDGTGYSSTVAPDGKSYLTGELSSGQGSPNNSLLTVTLGNSQTYDYGDFNLYLMFGNSDGVGLGDTALTVTIDGTTYSAPVTDKITETDKNLVQVEEFNIQGLAAGDSFTVGGAGPEPYFGAISFDASVPEPSSVALMLGAVGMLVLVQRMRPKPV